MQSSWILVWLLIAYSWDRLSCWSERLSCIQVKPSRTQVDVLNISSKAVQSPYAPMEFDLLMLQIDRVSLLYPDGEVTRMLSKITKSVHYEVYDNKILRIPADCVLKDIRLQSAPRLRTIKVSGINNGLESLQVFRNAIRRIPTSLHYLQSLESLLLNHGILESFNLEPLKGLYNLTHVFLLNNKLRRLENQLQIIEMEFFTPLKQLRELEIKSNLLKQIVANTPVLLPSLDHINFAYNQLTQLNFSNWIAPKLTKYVISSNNFTDFPLETARFANLDELTIASNQLTIIDLQRLKNLVLLTNLDAADNRLHTVLPDCQSMPSTPCQRVSLAALEVLDLQKNHLTTINFNLWYMPSLRSLNLQDNRLQRLQIPFNKFPNLGHVYFYNNFLNCLNIRSLETYIKNNKIGIKVEADPSTCSTNSSLPHPNEKGVICCND